MLSILILACHQEQIFSFEKTTSSSTNSAEPAAPTEEDSVEDTSAEDSASEPIDSDRSTCYRGAVEVVILESVAEFQALLDGVQINVVNFDDVDTSSDAPISIAADRYLESHGVYITGTDGQYVDDEFLWTSDYNSTSGTNMFAPGPVEIDGGGFNTTIHFKDASCTYGIGVMFIDADFPELGPSGIQAFDAEGSLIVGTSEFASEDGGGIFRGLAVLDEMGNPVKGIASGQITNGNVWPMSSCCDGVVLDDLMFGLD